MEELLIPTGLRCFEIGEVIDFNVNKILVNFCPYWVNDNDTTYKCLFLGVECDCGDENIKIWNGEKECNVNIYRKSKESKMSLNS